MRYPNISVHIESDNPLALVAAVREKLRHAGVARREIDAFSDEALTKSQAAAVRAVCKAWVNLGELS